MCILLLVYCSSLGKVGKEEDDDNEEDNPLAQGFDKKTFKYVNNNFY